MAGFVKIELPMDVYDELKLRARPFEDKSPADVIRRLLAADKGAGPVGVSSGGGYLASLLRAGVISSGDELVLERRRVGDRYLAQVISNGYLELEDGRTFASPSGAASACVGSAQNGWARWHHVRSGKSLGELRSESKAH